MGAATQAQPPARLPAYVLEWVGARVECPTTHGVEQGLVSAARRYRNVDHMALQVRVCLDSGGLWIGNATEVVRIAARTTEHMECDELGKPPT